MKKILNVVVVVVKDARRMDVAEYAIFFSLTKLAWAIAIAWIIFACHYGYGGVVNSILSGSAFLPITRLCFSAYLVHPTMMIYHYFLQEGLFHSTLLSLVSFSTTSSFFSFFLYYSCFLSLSITFDRFRVCLFVCFF